MPFDIAIGVAVTAVIAAIAYGVAEALVEVSLRHYVSRRWPRFAAWWGSVGGLYARFLVLFTVFGSTAVGLGLVAAGVIGGAGPEPVLLVIIVPTAVMAVWCLMHLAAVRRKGSTWRGYGRSSDGSWSAG